MATPATRTLRAMTIPELGLKTKIVKPLTVKQAQPNELYSVPRPFVATLYNRKKHELRSYHFKFLSTALVKMIVRVRRLEPGTVVEITHAVTSKQLATIKVRVNGRLETDGLWDLYD